MFELCGFESMYLAKTPETYPPLPDLGGPQNLLSMRRVLIGGCSMALFYLKVDNYLFFLMISAITLSASDMLREDKSGKERLWYKSNIFSSEKKEIVQSINIDNKTTY